jgi:hypothetical protein
MDKLNITIYLALQVCQTTINMFAINEIQGAVGVLNTCEGILGAWSMHVVKSTQK